jgi:hypothetical protein
MSVPIARRKRSSFPMRASATGQRRTVIRTDNYRARVLKKLAATLGLAKLNFQVLRRTMATLAQTNGGQPVTKMKADQAAFMEKAAGPH